VAELLAGVRVLDLTTSVAGPYCTLILAALGAEVVKVEHPERGDDTRAWGPPFLAGESATFLALNAGKRSLAVDVKAPEGLEAVRRLAARADVFVQNLRPGLAERLGLGFDALRAANPELVYCSIGAFGKVGPKRHLPGYDPLMQAAGGIMSITGEPDGAPVRAGVSVVDQGTGMWAAIAILAALRARDQDGRGRLVDTSLYETALNWLPYQLVGYLGTRDVPRQQGSSLAIIAPYQAFEAADRWLMVAAGNDRQFAALCRVVDAPELADDPRFASNPDRVAHREDLAMLLADRFRARPAASWLVLLEAAGVPAALIQDLAEVAEDEQTAALGILQPLAHPVVEDLRVVAPPVAFDDERVRHAAPPPALGEQSGEVLAEIGYGPQQLEELREAGVITMPPDRREEQDDRNGARRAPAHRRRARSAR
jgi:crotonobetainyl-CoA:carnitine CoA-transferase CaiB-like acyl-CoA transferase